MAVGGKRRAWVAALACLLAVLGLVAMHAVSPAAHAQAHLAAAAQADPAHAELAHTGPAQSGPAHAEPAHTAVAHVHHGHATPASQAQCGQDLHACVAVMGDGLQFEARHGSMPGAAVIVPQPSGAALARLAPGPGPPDLALLSVSRT